MSVDLLPATKLGDKTQNKLKIKKECPKILLKKK